MNYDFPRITNISDVLPAIEGRAEFTVAQKEGYTVINYNVMFEDTFPEVIHYGDLRANHDHYEIENFNARIRRECRGIIFDAETGDIIRRPFHKFFNVGERADHLPDTFDLSKPHVILEKLDGSMICPFLLNGELIFGTKMGDTDVAKPVQEFVGRHPEYEKMTRHMRADGDQPIFEWCSRKQRIVLDYGQEDQLILTAARNIRTGEYMDQALLEDFGRVYNIPVVKAFEPATDMKEFLAYVADLKDVEGFVIRFADGHMAKVKCHWYLQIHKAKEAILQDRNIVELILEEHLDDVKAHLIDEDRVRITKFESDFNNAVYRVVDKIQADHLALKVAGMDRKAFALNEAQKHDAFVRPILFRIFDEYTLPNILPLVHNMIRNNLTKTARYEEIRDAWFPDVKYNN
jgi:RNA ligase